ECGTYNGTIVSFSDQFASNAKEQDGRIKEFRQLKLASDSKFQHIPDTTKERQRYSTSPVHRARERAHTPVSNSSSTLNRFRADPIIDFQVSRRTRASTISSRRGSSSTTRSTRTL
ncbi:MAG: hypothetical protein ACKPKO_06650, partial [Candidatus Fonsibacter sp.]